MSNCNGTPFGISIGNGSSVNRWVCGGGVGSVDRDGCENSVGSVGDHQILACEERRGDEGGRGKKNRGSKG